MSATMQQGKPDPEPLSPHCLASGGGAGSRSFPHANRSLAGCQPLGLACRCGDCRVVCDKVSLCSELQALGRLPGGPRGAPRESGRASRCHPQCSWHLPAAVCPDPINISLCSALTFFRCALGLKNICFSNKCLQNGTICVPNSNEAIGYTPHAPSPLLQITPCSDEYQHIDQLLTVLNSASFHLKFSLNC